MILREDNSKKRFFNLSKEDEIDFEIEAKEKAEEEQVTKKVFEELDKKYKSSKGHNKRNPLR